MRQAPQPDWRRSEIEGFAAREPGQGDGGAGHRPARRGAVVGRPDPVAGVRVELASRLRGRSGEIAEAIFARVRALSDSAVGEDAEYVGGLRTAVAETVRFGIDSIEHGEGWEESVPEAALAQTRRAVRNGVSLDTVLRRYAAGDRLLREFVMDRSDHLPNQALQQILATHGPQFDRFVGYIATEYTHEYERMMRSPTRHLSERVQGLLSGGDPRDAGDLAYDFGAWHLGLVATGAKARDAVRALAKAMDRQALIVPRGSELVWAWLGGRREFHPADVEQRLRTGQSDGTSLAMGEPREGIDGWRLTHHEAQAGVRVMAHCRQRLIRGSRVLLLAAILGNEALTESLLETYLAPLDQDPRSGQVLRETLRAYFLANGNAATTAVALGVNRHTVSRRLQKIEARLGRPLQACRAELEVALRFEDFKKQAAAGLPLG